MRIEVVPATSQRWSDVAAVFAGRSGRNACWCQRFRRHDFADNQAALEHEIHSSSVPIGLVAYLDRAAAGWSSVVPRHTLPGVIENQALRRLFGDELDTDRAVWWVTCFAIRRNCRGHGVGGALLRAAIDFARERGAEVLYGHPVDVAALKSSPSPAALFTGTRSMFVAAGFEEIGRTYVSRPVMRKALT